MNKPCPALLLALLALGYRAPVAAADISLSCAARPVEDRAFTTGGIIEINADSSQADIGAQRITFAGNVELLQGNRRLTADEISYNKDDDVVDASGNILFSQPGIILGGDRAHAELGSRQLNISPVRFELPAIGGRGTAAEGTSTGNELFRAEQIEFTTCPQGDDAWLLKAGELQVDRAAGFAKARNATLSLGRVPVLASPWLQFPVGDRRLSGFLVPRASYSSRDGLDLALPYYLNLAPNYDATLFPRIISERGAMLGAEFRYLFPGTHRGTLYGEALPNDRLYEGDNSFRGAFRVDHRSRFSERFRGLLRYTALSDDNYLEDLGRDLGITSTRYLENVFELRYFGDTWEALANWTQQEVLGDFDRPISRFPQLLYRLDQPLPANSRLLFDAEYANFERNPGTSGPRLDLYSALEGEWRKPWGYLRPRVGGRFTQYRLDTPIEEGPENPERTLYSLSLDSGLYFDRNARLLATEGVQTLEPRVFYLYVPYRDQDDQPNYDSTLPDLSYPNLFRQNRFTGADRVGDANQLTLGLTTRFIEAPSVRERLSASIGQVLFFEDRRVQLLPDAPPETDSTSPLVGELDLTLSQNWSTTAVLHWDIDDSRMDDGLLRVGYDNRSERELVYLAYRYNRRHDLKYTDLAFDWPLTSQIRFVGRWQYSLSTDRTMEALGGLEYDSCCWRLRGAVRRYIATTEGDYDNSLFIQLELKGLGRLGDNIDELLRRSIYGYDPFEN